MTEGFAHQLSPAGVTKLLRVLTVADENGQARFVFGHRSVPSETDGHPQGAFLGSEG